MLISTIQKVYEYLEKTYGENNVILYGSSVEYLQGFIREPRDFDAIIISDTSKEEILNVDFTDIDINLNFMTLKDVLKEANELQPKLFSICAADSVRMSIEKEMKKNSIPEIRSKISSFSSKAYAKGKKKLIIEEDYDMDLGLKNIVHSFKFRLLAEYFFAGVFSESVLISRCNEIHNEVYNRYSVQGTLDEKYNSVLEYAKPLLNELMSEFRIHFPKECNLKDN